MSEEFRECTCTCFVSSGRALRFEFHAVCSKPRDRYTTLSPLHWSPIISSPPPPLNPQHPCPSFLPLYNNPLLEPLPARPTTANPKDRFHPSRGVLDSASKNQLAKDRKTDNSCVLLFTASCISRNDIIGVPPQGFSDNSGVGAGHGTSLGISWIHNPSVSAGIADELRRLEVYGTALCNNRSSFLSLRYILFF